MSASWLYRQEPLWILASLVVAMVLVGELATRLGRHWYPHADDIRRGHLVSVQISVLGLVALLLSFACFLSNNRYETLRVLVVSDANSLNALYLRSSLLPDPPRKEFKQLLRQYVDLNSQVALLRHHTSAGETAQAESLQGQMWKLIANAAQRESSPKVAEPMLQGLIEASSIQRERMFAFEGHVPDAVIWLLLLGAVIATAMIGFSGGLGNHRAVPARIILAILLCATTYVLLDLDHPHEGFIRVSQSPMLHLKQIMDRDPETTP